ncbi:MAG: radical SAM protein [Deltaproteobacteria bacterium]|nr:radical SAM protein [Deltaproteobacteria bacterium]
MSLTVCETFYSLMGESTAAGLAAFFIRLAGCNLRCRYCDTTYAYEGGMGRSIADLVGQGRTFPVRLALVTGGEPLLQADTPALLVQLADAGFTVFLETNGSLPIRDLDPRVRRIVDLKCPGSGMSAHNYWPNLKWLAPGDEVKFVISDRPDFDWAVKIIKERDLTSRVPVLISPVFGVVTPRDAAAWILASGLPLRLNLQLHKYIWGPEVRGV